MFESFEIVLLLVGGIIWVVQWFFENAQKLRRKAAEAERKRREATGVDLAEGKTSMGFGEPPPKPQPKPEEPPTLSLPGAVLFPQPPPDAEQELPSATVTLEPLPPTAAPPTAAPLPPPVPQLQLGEAPERLRKRKQPAARKPKKPVRKAPSRPGVTDAAHLQRVLRSTRGVRTAWVLGEILERPVALRRNRTGFGPR